MVELSGDFHHPVTKPTKMSGISQNKPFTGTYYGEQIVKCEDCPAGKVCKKIGNYRKSCEGGSGSANDHTTAKCMAGAIILLAKLIERKG